MKKVLILFFLALVISSCHYSKDKAKKLWGLFVDKASTELTTTKKVTFNEVFGTADSLKVQDMDGLWVDYPAAFYACFLKYKADKIAILNYLSRQYTRLPNISDSTYQVTDTTEVYKQLRAIEKDFPDVKKQLGFFFEIRQKNNLEYYKCSKYPNSHLIIVDTATGIIYHSFEKYWD